MKGETMLEALFEQKKFSVSNITGRGAFKGQWRLDKIQFGQVSVLRFSVVEEFKGKSL